MNWGCIPTKALLKSAQVFEYINHAEDYGIKVTSADADFSAVIKRSRDVAGGMSKGIEFLMKKNKIEVLKGTGKVGAGKKVVVTDDKGKATEYSAKNIILATGARSRQLPNLIQDGKKIIGYRDAMVLKKAPKKMIVVGSGAIGVEFAYFYNAMGTEVTIVEYMPNIVPVEDIDVSKQLERSLLKNPPRSSSVPSGESDEKTSANSVFSPPMRRPEYDLPSPSPPKTRNGPPCTTAGLPSLKTLISPSNST